MPINSSRRGFLTFVAGTSISGCAGLPSSLRGDSTKFSALSGREAWPTSGGDSQNTHANPSAAGPSQGVRSRSTYQDLPNLDTFLVVDDDIYATSDIGLIAFSLTDEEVRWSSAADSGSQLVTKDFVLSTDGDLRGVVIDRQTGDIQWQFPKLSSNSRTPDSFAIASGTVFGADTDGDLYAARGDSYQWVHTPTPRWRGERILRNVLANKHGVVRVSAFPVGDGHGGGGYYQSVVEGFSQTGLKLFKQSVPGNVLSASLAGPHLYCSVGLNHVTEPQPDNYTVDTALGQIYRYDLESGHLRRRMQYLEAEPLLAITDSTLIIGLGTAVIQVNRALTKERWRMNGFADVNHLIAGDNAVYVAEERDEGAWFVHCLALKTGAQQWKTQVTEGRISQLALAGNTLYVLCEEPNKLVLLNA